MTAFNSKKYRSVNFSNDGDLLSVALLLGHKDEDLRSNFGETTFFKFFNRFIFDDLASDELSADGLSVDGLSANDLSVDELSADELSAVELSADELSADELSADELPADELAVDFLGWFEKLSLESFEFFWVKKFNNIV